MQKHDDAKIRRAAMVDGLSRREAAKRFGVHRNTISKMLQLSIPPDYRRRERSALHAAAIRANSSIRRSVI
jgi:transcriptional regulator with XRE-family HTH domain